MNGGFLSGFFWITFGLDLLAMGIVDVPICMFEWFVTNGPLVKLAGFGDVIAAVAVVASPVSVTSTFVLSTCNRFRNVTNSLLRLFKRCCKWTASFVDEASAKERTHKKKNEKLNFLDVIRKSRITVDQSDTW